MCLLSCVGTDLATGCSPVQRVPPTVYGIHSLRIILNGNRSKGLIRRQKKEIGKPEIEKLGKYS
jgi:hypothetical protein